MKENFHRVCVAVTKMASRYDLESLDEYADEESENMYKEPEEINEMRAFMRMFMDLVGESESSSA